VATTGVDDADRVYLSGRYATRDMWVRPMWKGKPQLGPHLLPDGRRLTDVVADGDIDEVPFPVWFQPSNGGKRLGDLLWAGGLSTKLVSRRLVDVLQQIGATGYRTYEVTFVDRKRNPIDGYIGVASTGSDEELDITHYKGFQNTGLYVKRHLLDALLSAGVDGFDVGT
jgi:hypothetical protein